MKKERLERNKAAIDAVLESAALERKLLNDLRSSNRLTNMDIELAKTQISNNKNVVSALLADMHLARIEGDSIEVEAVEENKQLEKRNKGVGKWK